MNKKKTNVRPFVSVSLFCMVIVFLITAVMIEVLDHAIIDPEVLLEISMNNGNQFAYFPARLLYIVKRIHVIIGYFFLVLSLLHIVKNWKALMGYMKRGKKADSYVSSSSLSVSRP